MRRASLYLPTKLSGQRREVPAEEAEKIAKERNLRWIETSAKCNANVTRVFDMCLEEIEKSMHPNDGTAATAATDATTKNKDNCVAM